MQRATDNGSAEVWTAAQHRRTEDLAELFGAAFQKIERAASIWRLPRVALIRGLTVAIAAFVVLASASGVVHGGKTHFVPKAIAEPARSE
jgi:hypothetical protein